MVELLPRLKGIVLRRDFGVLTVVSAGEEGSGDEDGSAGVLERALASKLL